MHGFVSILFLISYGVFVEVALLFLGRVMPFVLFCFVFFSFLFFFCVSKFHFFVADWVEEIF